MKTYMAYILIFAGIALFVTGVFLLNSKKVFTPKFTKAGPLTTEIVQSSPADKELDNNEKGNLFEQYVVQQFDPKYFRLEDWRSDKYVNGIYPISNHFPDLKIAFNLGNTYDSFAVECKWRKNFYKDSVEWAAGYQVENYKRYAAEMGIPVFVVIGVGGLPRKPEEIFVVPLAQMDQPSIARRVLFAYKKDMKKNFYWDSEKKVLR